MLKKADDATPARISFLKSNLHQGIAVLVLFVAFFVGFLISVVSNTAGCSVENGCVTCSVESNVNAEKSAEYSLGCEPIAVPSFDLNQLDGCASGIVKNDKTQLLALADAGQDLVTKLEALCKNAMSAKCSDGTTAFKDFDFNAQPDLENCVDGLPGHCMAQDNAYQNYYPKSIRAFPKDEASCEGIFTSWVDAWEKSLVSESLRSAAVWSSTNSLIDFNVEELKKLHTSFGYYTPTKMKSTVVGYMVKMAQIKCWVDQMHEELVANPADYPKTVAEDPNAWGKVLFVPFMADGNPASVDPKSPNPSKAILIKPGGFSGNCGNMLSSLEGLEEHETSIFAGHSWWVASIQEIRPQQTSGFDTIVNIQSIDKTTCRRKVKDPVYSFDYDLDEICSDANQYRATGTGEFSCCSEMSATNVLSSGYAFAGIAMSAVGVLVAVFVYALCGKAMVDMDEFKKAAKGVQGDAGEMHTVAASAHEGAGEA